MRRMTATPETTEPFDLEAELSVRSSTARKGIREVKMQIGDVNSNNQRLLAKTMQPGSGRNARIWILECQEPDCQFRYGVNGHDAWRRRCPECQDGMPGSNTARPHYEESRCQIHTIRNAEAIPNTRLRQTIMMLESRRIRNLKASNSVCFAAIIRHSERCDCTATHGATATSNRVTGSARFQAL